MPDVNVRAKQTSQHYQHALRQRYEEILGSTNRTEREMRDNLKALRKIILTDGLPETMDVGQKAALLVIAATMDGI